MAITFVEGKPRDLGGFSVRRILPSAACRSVGPFVFFDHLGPAVLEDGPGIQVRPHPHIGLATVTYLFEGELMHRDSLGSVQAIRPGDVNWMTSGRGIVHSERSAAPQPGSPLRVHALQSWVALPLADEDGEPSFSHHPAASLPSVAGDGLTITVILGDAFGCRSPVPVRTRTLYALVELETGARFTLDATHDERAAFVIAGDVVAAGVVMPPQVLGVFEAGLKVAIEARSNATVILMGGAALDAPRALEWNFVSSDRAAIARAKSDWTSYPNTRFPLVPGEADHIPLPDAPRPAAGPT